MEAQHEGVQAEGVQAQHEQGRRVATFPRSARDSCRCLT
jgi:hypothetical protein